MTDEEMVAYLARCQLDPSMPRPSIETLLHAFVPHPHVDHTHPDAIGAIVGAVDGERLAEECFGADAVWIPYIRPGFALSKLVAEAVRAARSEASSCSPSTGSSPGATTAAESYAATLEAINRAAAFVESTGRGAEPFGGAARSPLDDDRRVALLAEVLPALRGALSVDGPRILQVDLSPAVLEFVDGQRVAPSSRRSAPPAPTTSSTPSGGRSGSSSIPRAKTPPRCASALVEQVGRSTSASAPTSSSTGPRTTSCSTRARASS